ncbi:MAG: response regulator transcription factor [Dehalococcoidales bacterium]|nr:response regulator transcription factor [Dehalococcoidales bacterium]MDD3264777.1 response regulator transcription factor [Dehalococcoidales bacterium]MDD4322428.1 response regulator transcription factor [Dehalococcoidales bacterium]MDD4794074.1 response regulator transcription factor [Dehalococcoidales bacterium]MDD5122570.1 response regulator transcription factor [Dehalococcoidales bacterium]
MAKILIVSDTSEADELSSFLNGRGLSSLVLPGSEDILQGISDNGGNLVIILLSNFTLANNIARIIKQEKKLPVLMLVQPDKIVQVALPMEADDFVLYPGQEEELSLRIKRLLPGNGAILSEECIHCGDLVVDLASCEVSLKGEVLDLTFREYELLKFLALNRGRTFTREALLNRVWGYDYFGGDRTVDVHIRRLRTKTGDLDNPYIETVRNIGYRFRKKD